MKTDERRRLLERLQQRVLGGGHERVRFIDDHDPPAAFERPVGRAIDDVAHLIDLDGAAVARLDDQHVGMNAASDARAGRARRRTHRSEPLRRRSAGDVRRRRSTVGQFSAWAVATASRRLPTPEGPARIRLGGSDP